MTIFGKRSTDSARVQVIGLNFAREDKERGLGVFLPVFFVQLDGSGTGLLERDQAVKALALFVNTSCNEMGLRPMICSKVGSTFAK